MRASTSLTTTRIDKWLWAARFYKTRQLAIKAIKNGQIDLNSSRPKPSSNVTVGDIVKIKKGLYVTSVEILLLLEKRGPATLAQTMYQETKTSIAARRALKTQLASQPKIEIDRNKPDKRELRTSRRLKRGE
jgi:ribosome-associated heat shock protein Hsp15